MSDMVYIREWKPIGLAQGYIEYVKLCAKSLMMQIYQNDLGFSLYTMPSISYVVILSENWIDFKVRVSTNISMLLLNTKNRVQ